MEDPVADAVRGLLDGHIVLSRALAERGHYPAIDILGSISRAMASVADEDHRDLASRLRQLLAAYRDAEDLIQVGAYAKGSDALVDEAIQRRASLESFLTQDMAELAPMEASIVGLSALTEAVQ